METHDALPLDGAIIILMLETATASKLEFELKELGAEVYAGAAPEPAAHLTRTLIPFAVVVDPEVDDNAAEILRVAARDVDVMFIQYAQDGFGFDGGIRVPKTEPVSAVIETILGHAAE
ncbi:hypothetical protein ACC691_26445 [Rhizobium johnstonii]|uniref:hypothetical protein n=1 Tax=Rhizobium johnstonii TaxID=3019933 RepID=UPI003F9B97ED